MTKKPLLGRMLEIATGRAGLPLDKVATYRATWDAQGFDVPPYEGPPLPPVTNRILNYAKAQLAHTAKGRPEVSEEEWQRRMAICQSNQCGLATLVNERVRCTHPSCGCFLEIKARWQEQQCPVGLW
jgi:hypothetical protein